MSNPRNTGVLVGRLANDPKVFTNKDGSRKVLLTVFVDRNYTDRNNERISDAIPVEAFFSSKVQGVGPYENTHKGDQIALQTTLQHQSWTTASGETKYETKVIAEAVSYLESRSVTQNRMAQRVAELEAQAGQVQAVAQPGTAVAEEPAF